MVKGLYNSPGAYKPSRFKHGTCHWEAWPFIYLEDLRGYCEGRTADVCLGSRGPRVDVRGGSAGPISIAIKQEDAYGED